MVHLWEDECVAAGAMLHMVLLALWVNDDRQQVSQVGNVQGQQAEHVTGGGENKTGGREETTPPRRAQMCQVSFASY